MSFESGGSGVSSGPTLCSSRAEGTNTGAPWLPSKGGTVGGWGGHGDATVCRDTIIHTLKFGGGGYPKGGVGARYMREGEREQ